MTGWDRMAYAAARARLAEHRPLDAAWVAAFENDTAATCRQTGEDPVLALDAVAAGLHAAAMWARTPQDGSGAPNAARTAPWPSRPLTGPQRPTSHRRIA